MMLNIYVSYRKEDNPLLVKRIYEVLVREFGGNSVVKDVFYARDILKPTPANPMGEVQWAINRCDVMLIIIGRYWFTDKAGNRLLADTKDLILQELGFAFTRKGLPIIPVLIDNAKAPTEAQLGPALRILALKNPAVVRDGAEFERDMMRLIDQLNKLVSGQISGVRTLTDNEPEADAEPFDANIAHRRKTITMLGLAIGGGIGLIILALLVLQSIPK
ncbi:MAG: hypothetical protein KJ043_24220 [Anaerolineae bacterium]|nr:hypothetical protein [Anaerolineae bacterium]